MSIQRTGHYAPPGPSSRMTDAAADKATAPPPSDRDALMKRLQDKYQKLLDLARSTHDGRTGWFPGKSLSAARPAHATNTREQFEQALKDGANFLEGDIRAELDPPHALEMRHDPVSERGDNLSLEEWLAIGAASGRAMKLDVKEPSRMPDVIRTVRASGIDPQRVMFNLDFNAMAKWGPELRQVFPAATLALNPPASSSGKLDNRQVDELLRQAGKMGAPLTFVVRYDKLTPEALSRLQNVAPVSVWNASNGPTVKDASALSAELRRQGIQGVIDIRATPDAKDKVFGALERARQEVLTRLFH
ncbi:MAG: DUF2181 domain-containing protein [Candidatus Sericytochromatia bacterium]|nr:DUF2181 domain-containing protein [Candidatus Sericytochromatia bacterium]